MAIHKISQPFITSRGKTDPAKADTVARGRVSALQVHGTPLGDTSVSPLTPTPAQALNISQSRPASVRHFTSIRYDTAYLDI